MTFLFLLIVLYLLAAFRLDIFYSGRYFWQEGQDKERFFTGLLQPFMELFGNGMTAHFWHFKDVKFETKDLDKKFLLKLSNHKKPFRRLSSGKFLAVLTSAWVDTNPLQDCAIIKPKNYNGKWQLFFPINSKICQLEKCSHYGAVKVAVDGSGTILAKDEQGKFIELELVEYCKAWQQTHILFV
jgi:hypothetical protein